MVKEIQLTQGKVALVDDADFDFINQFTWHVQKGSSRDNENRIYAVSSINDGLIYMHKLILGLPNDMQGDHKNLNTLDNQRCNLRLCTDSQNKANRIKYNNSRFTSRYKGVSYEKRLSKWSARICFNSISRRLGCFQTEVEAAFAYDKVARELFGEFARTNF